MDWISGGKKRRFFSIHIDRRVWKPTTENIRGGKRFVMGFFLLSTSLVAWQVAFGWLCPLACGHPRNEVCWVWQDMEGDWKQKPSDMPRRKWVRRGLWQRHDAGLDERFYSWTSGTIIVFFVVVVWFWVKNNRTKSVYPCPCLLFRRCCPDDLWNLRESSTSGMRPTIRSAPTL